MLIRLRRGRGKEKAAFRFAWLPVLTECGHLAWLEVVVVERGYAVGHGNWTKFYLANPIEKDNDLARAAIAKATGAAS